MDNLHLAAGRVSCETVQIWNNETETVSVIFRFVMKNFKKFQFTYCGVS